MANDQIREVFRALRESQNKYVYFLLAAAGAAIGLAINQTQHAPLAWSKAPLGLAVTAWGVSFITGCRHLAHMHSALNANVELLNRQSGHGQDSSTDSQLVGSTSQEIKDTIQKETDRADLLGNWQFGFLMTGAVFYIAWHVLEMWLRVGASETAPP